MRKQKKNLKHSLRLKNLTTFHTIKHNLKYRLYTSMVKIASLYRSNKIRYTIFLKIKQNNLFCTFKNIITNKVLLVASAGKLQLNVSKNKLFFLQKKIIFKFLKKVKWILKKQKSSVILKLISPLKLRRRVLRHVKILLRKRPLVIIFSDLKIFNGCRPKKKRRKKGLRNRIT
jgi:hypothetical protein